jgi:DNA repair exonuclease SbcCD ATPase subunit
MDLFNPPIEFNYKNNMKEVNFESFENPYIQVVWEDTPENFTTERIKSVKTYFETKYKSKNVNVITKVKTSNEENQSVDVAVNILDENFQKDLINQYLVNNKQDKLKDDIFKLDRVVESKISDQKSEVSPFKKWYINKIEFSNFLSFGDGQILDFNKIKGINTIESNPPNFGGKTVLSVDLLLFLFFNTTTKTNKAEEVFNRFRDKDKVSVVGDITIDGEDYIIARSVERKMSKSGEWNVKTNLDFFKKLADGSLQNFTGEQRRETENFIKNSIGTMDDFLMTILTTASNLEDLIDSKPTARGQVLSRFLGLDSLKLKEETVKELASAFSKSMISNVYNTESLKNEIIEKNELIENSKKEITEQEKLLVEVQDSITKGVSFRDELIAKKNTNIDRELVKLKPAELQSEIDTHNRRIVELTESIKSVNVVEPKEFYHEDKHDEVRREISDTNITKAQVDIKIESLEKLKSEVSGGIKCDHCGIDLISASLTQQKLSEMDSLKEEQKNFLTKLISLTETEKGFTQLKKDFDEYEKNKLIKEKFEVQIEAAALKKNQSEEKLKKYQEYQTILEENKKIDETIIRADMKLSALENQKSSHITQIQTLKDKIEVAQEKINKNNQLILQIAEEFEKEKIYKVYSEIFGKNGISKMIMKTMMPVINSELQRLLADSAKFKLEIRINEKNEVEFLMIDNETQIEKLMSSGSGFERTIASLALRAVLSKVCSLPKPNIIVFDEVFGKISNDNLEMVYEFFVKIKTYFDKILIITHNPMLSQWSDGVIKIEKTENVSKVIQC